MSYSTLIFASVILPISVLVLFFDRSAEYKNLILCIVSVLFVSWGRSILAALIFLSVIVDYLIGLAAQRSADGGHKPVTGVLLLIDLLWNTGIFLLFTRGYLLTKDGALSLSLAMIPVGAAFYALKNFSYVFDVCSGRCKAEKNPFLLMTYSMAYPFLLAGPVVRFADIEPQLRERTMDTGLLSSGLTRFAVGLAKTVIVVPVLDKLYLTGLDPNEPTLAGAWIGMIAFFGAAYFSFMGLSDMGTGIARMNGFDVEVNYTRVSAKRMLGSLVKSYNTSMVRLAEDMREANPALLTILIAAAGAAFYSQDLHLIAAGVVLGILLTVEWAVGYERLERIPGIIKLAVTFALSMLLFSSFAFASISEWSAWLGRLVGRGDLYILSKALKKLLINNCFLLGIAFVSISPIGEWIATALDGEGDGSQRSYISVRTLKTVCTALLLIASFVLLAARTAA